MGGVRPRFEYSAAGEGRVDDHLQELRQCFRIATHLASGSVFEVMRYILSRMKHLFILSSFLLSLTFSVSGQTAAPKQPQPVLYKTGNPADWPKEQGAVVSARKNHKILLENDEVRVLEVTVLPGEKESVHHHQWPSVLYITQAGDFIDRDASGNVIFDTRKLPEPLKFPLTMYKEPEAPHSVENLSKTVAIKLIRVEMKK
mgnify:CR=1 FL=1